MKINNLFLAGLLPLALMIYGWYLSRSDQSMQDLGGILVLIIGTGGLLLSAAIQILIRKTVWAERWWFNLLTGLVGIVLAFIFMIVYSRIQG